MGISGTFLKSKVAYRIALILFLAAFIPAGLVTVLTYNTVNKLVSNNSHKELVDTSHNIGLSALSNLLFARTSLMVISDSITSSSQSRLSKILSKKYVMFDALLQTTPEGIILDQTENAKIIPPLHKIILIEAIKNISSNKTKLLVLPKSENENNATVLLVMKQDTKAETRLVAAINPIYLWGDPADYPAEISVCIYRILKNINSPIFCSTDQSNKFKESNKPENIGDWELFLRGEFDGDSWRFVSQRLNPLTARPLGNFLNSYGYIGAAVTSLLIVALLSLIQIRKTMVPLEQLVKGTKNISQGKYIRIEVEGESEFAHLANSFNGMTASIKRQFDTLQTLSAIDREMISNLDVNQIIDQIIGRVQTLLPSTIICVLCLDEESDNTTQCSISISDKISLISPRIAIPMQEINAIKSYESGLFGRCNNHNMFVHENFLSELKANYTWLLPIFWQGEMCAFICIADEFDLPQDGPHWPEINELAGRVSIAISAQKRENQLLLQAQYDNLTGLPNRILLQDRIRQAIEQSDRSGEDFWLIFIDLDRFKFVNDSLGHQAGDLLLSQVAQRLKLAVRDNDTVARLGGDEFIILQGEMEGKLRTGTVRRLIKALETPFTINNNEIVVTCSAGVSVYPTDTNNADTLLSNADIAMYRAKELGKNNFQFFTKSMNEKVAEHLLLETHLRKAIELNELEMFYQPKVSLLTKQIVGMEALIRWNSKVLDFISPVQFIPLAEETGLIIPIGEWALKTACAQAVVWRNAGLGHFVMAVNLSARQFNQSNLIESITSIIEETGIDPQQLELELTESMVMGNADGAMQMLQKIKSLGIHLSIDDFGTGYSSLSYLKKLPVSTLKIDKSFIDDIVLHTDEAPIVASIISLAKNLKLKVVAEGVELFEQVRYLTAHGCNEIQGYYFSKPAKATTIEKLLKLEKKLEQPLLKSYPV